MNIRTPALGGRGEMIDVTSFGSLGPESLPSGFWIVELWCDWVWT